MASNNYKVRYIDAVHQACESSAWWITKIFLCADQKATVSDVFIFKASNKMNDIFRTILTLVFTQLDSLSTSFEDDLSVKFCIR